MQATPTTAPHKTRKSVVIGFLGTKLDSGMSAKRWLRWRPSVALVAHPEICPDVIELLSFNGEAPELRERVVADIAEKSPQTCVRHHTLGVTDPWSFESIYAVLHDFARNYPFEEDTDYFVHLTTGTHVAQICLFLLTEARYFPARLLQTGYDRQISAEDFWRGNFDVIDLDISRYDLLAARHERERLQSQDLLKGGIVTRNAKFNALIQRLEQVAIKSSAPLLLTGPTGAGKTELAKRVYELRARRHLLKGQGRLVEVNCATLRGDNAMSALFGHKRGAFTGALSDRAGLLASAHRGMLFLDEIGELGLDEQAMLLRALEEKRFMPMGSDREVESDFQLIAGTNRDLHSEVRAGRFRADLLARISMWHFELPGLAQRPEDIEPNLDFELQNASAQLRTRISMSRPAREIFLAHAMKATWEGNFREFSTMILRLATLAMGGRITENDVRFELEQAQLARAGHHEIESPSTLAPHLCEIVSRLAPSLDRIEIVQLEEVLMVISQTDSMAEAGRVLFAHSRALKSNPNDTDRIRKFLVRYGLTYNQIKAGY